MAIDMKNVTTIQDQDGNKIKSIRSGDIELWHNTYVPIEYEKIEHADFLNDNSNYINSGIILNSETDVVKIKFKLSSIPDTAEAYPIFGARSLSTVTAYTFAEQNGKWSCGWYSTYNTDIDADLNEHELIINNGSFILDGTEILKATHDPFVTPVTAWIGAFRTYNSSSYPRRFGNVDIFDFQIYRNGSAIRHFIPVYNSDSDETGLYDTITQAFYPIQIYS